MFAIFAYEFVQGDGAFGGGDAAQEGEHDGFVHIQEGIGLAQVALHQDIHLGPHQVVDDGEVGVLAEESLAHAFAEEADRVLCRAVVALLQEFVGAGIFLQVLEEAFAGGVIAFDAALIPFQQDLQYVARFGNLLHILVFLLHIAADALDEQRLFVCKDFVERALGDAERGGYVVHRDALDAVFGKEQAGGFDDFLLEFPAGGGVFGRFVHDGYVLGFVSAKLRKGNLIGKSRFLFSASSGAGDAVLLHLHG